MLRQPGRRFLALPDAAVVAIQAAGADKVWRGENEIWIPYESSTGDPDQNSWCMPAASCGEKVSCEDGEVYEMYNFTATDVDETLSIQP